MNGGLNDYVSRVRNIVSGDARLRFGKEGEEREQIYEATALSTTTDGVS